jgi:hypothetical protein
MVVCSFMQGYCNNCSRLLRLQLQQCSNGPAHATAFHLSVMGSFMTL